MFTLKPEYPQYDKFCSNTCRDIAEGRIAPTAHRCGHCHGTFMRKPGRKQEFCSSACYRKEEAKRFYARNRSARYAAWFMGKSLNQVLRESRAAERRNAGISA